MMTVTHNSMAMLGLTLALLAGMLLTQPGLRESAENRIFGIWPCSSTPSIVVDWQPTPFRQPRFLPPRRR
jgi:hypothetical protein